MGVQLWSTVKWLGQHKELDLVNLPEALPGIGGRVPGGSGGQG